MSFTLSQCEVEEAQEDDEEQDAEPHDIPVCLQWDKKSQTDSVYTRNLISIRGQVFPTHLSLFLQPWPLDIINILSVNIKKLFVLSKKHLKLRQML